MSPTLIRYADLTAALWKNCGGITFEIAAHQRSASARQPGKGWRAGNGAQYGFRGMASAVARRTRLLVWPAVVRACRARRSDSPDTDMRLNFPLNAHH